MLGFLTALRAHCWIRGIKRCLTWVQTPLGPFSVGFACSSNVCVDFHQVLQFPHTSKDVHFPLHKGSHLTRFTLQYGLILNAEGKFQMERDSQKCDYIADLVDETM